MPASPEAGALVDAHLTELCQRVQAAFAGLLDGVDPANVIGFALFSDADGADLTAAINTRDDLAANLSRYSDPEYSRGLPPEFSWERYLRWAPGEWSRSSLTHAQAAAEPMRELWTRIAELSDEAPKRDREYWPSIQFEAAVIAIGIAWEQGWFDAFPDAVRVFAVMDGDEDAQTRARWLDSLNPDRWEEVNAYVTYEA